MSRRQLGFAALLLLPSLHPSSEQEVEAPDTHIPVSRRVSEVGEGRTPLSLAALHGQLDAVRLLLSYGSTVDLGRVRSGTNLARGQGRTTACVFLYSHLDRFLLAI